MHAQANHNSNTQFYQHSRETYTYKDYQVKIITVFNDKKESTALVEDQFGEIHQVPMSSLR